MTTRRGCSRWLAAATTLVIVVAGCGDDDTAGDDRSDADDNVRSASLDVGTVHSFDIDAMDGCDPDEGEDPDEDGKIVCLHVDREVTYQHTPPVGGMHAPVPQDCRFYDEPIFNEGAVHSLEHGAVWITFDPDLPQDQVDHIKLLAADPKVLASPWDLDELPAPIVLSAWGLQLPVAELPDESATQFLADHVGGPAAPKPTAPCSGAYDGTRANP